MTEHLITRPARLVPCPACHHHTLTATTSGLEIRADPHPLDIHAEIAALITGRFTYDVLAYGLPRRLYLEWRSTTRIRDTRKYPVVATHTCNTKPPPTFQPPDTYLTVPYQTGPLPDIPPF